MATATPTPVPLPSEVATFRLPKVATDALDRALAALSMSAADRAAHEAASYVRPSRLERAVACFERAREVHDGLLAVHASRWSAMDFDRFRDAVADMDEHRSTLSAAGVLHLVEAPS